MYAPIDLCMLLAHIHYQVLGRSLPLSIIISLVHILDDSYTTRLLTCSSVGFVGSSRWEHYQRSTGKLIT